MSPILEQFDIIGEILRRLRGSRMTRGKVEGCAST